jgi:hypothetical protein
MLISKIHLPRRTVLKALGATVGLPFLDAMIPAGTAGRAFGRTAAASRLSMSFIYFPHGAVLDQWTPGTGPAGLELPPILAPLAPFRDQLTVVSGLENRAAIAPPVHALTPATWLSCSRPGVDVGARPDVSPAARDHGVTVDQLVARKLGQGMPFDSIQAATEVSGGEGSSDRIYGDEYARTISFRADASTTGHPRAIPLPMEHDPRRLFRRIFGQHELGRREAAALRSAPVVAHDGTAAASRSVLDLVRHDAADLTRKLGPRDNALLADFFDNIRTIEQRVAAFVPAAAVAAPDASGEAPTLSGHASPTRFDEHIGLMFDLIALAYQANATRVTTFMMAAEVSQQTYDFIGVPDSFHSLSHHGNSPAKLARLTQVQARNTALFAQFVGKLAAMPDGEGSMLDHSLILYGSNMGNSNRHDHSELPVALLGGACGKLRGNRYLRCPQPTPLANLHLALLRKVGISAAAFGDSTGELSGV